MTNEGQESAPHHSCYGQPSPELLARAERGLLRFFVRWPDSDIGNEASDAAERPSDV